jgi:ferritin-like metal-binding protein YciE
MPDAASALVPWLNDAYAMENALIQLFVDHARDAETSHPAIHARLTEYLERTRAHVQILSGCIERLGTTPSVIKAGLGSLFGALEAFSMDVLTNEVLMNAIADYAAINYGIATYTALIAAAEEAGDLQTAEACRQILREQREMAEWLEMQIPPAVHEMVQKQAAS